MGRLFLFLLDLISCSFFFLLSRELAIQIAEQFEALGSDISLRCAVVSSDGFKFLIIHDWNIGATNGVLN